MRIARERWPSLWSMGRTKRWLLVAAILFAVPTVLMAFLFQPQAVDLLARARYNDVFDASQTQAELLRLDAEIGRYVVDHAPDGANAVALRFEIFMNHIAVMNGGLMGRTLEAVSPGLPLRLTETITAAEPMIARLDSTEAARRLLALFTPLETELAQATAQVSAQSATSITDAGETLRVARDTLLVLTMALLMAALGLAAVLWRQHSDMRRLAYRDTLTGLASRLAFNAALERERGAESVAVILADVDHFKDVNDGFGHDVGDALLRQMASRLIAATPEAKVIARLGGDEFAVVVRGPVTVDGLAAIAERIRAAAAEPFRLGDLLLRSGLSMGLLVDHARDPVGLLKRADLALYAAKAAGRGRHCLFDPSLERDFQARRDMEDELRAAVAEDGIAVHFQPVVDLATGRPLICEALARWDHPRLGRVPPSEFIPIAERSALIVALGHCVLARACAEATTWPGAVRVAVNVSSQQITETDFTERVAAILAETGLDPRRLEIEITESVLLRTDGSVLDAIGRLKRLGVTFALDDFGTGYSSLGRLHRLPLDKLKIDQTFTRAMEDSREALDIVETIVDLARKLGMAITAEGVETPSQHALLLRAGCDQGQGYLYARPMLPEACRQRLADLLDGPAAPPAGEPVTVDLAQVA